MLATVLAVLAVGGVLYALYRWWEQRGATRDESAGSLEWEGPADPPTEAELVAPPGEAPEEETEEETEEGTEQETDAETEGEGDDEGDDGDGPDDEPREDDA